MNMKIEKCSRNQELLEIIRKLQFDPDSIRSLNELQPLKKYVFKAIRSMKYLSIHEMNDIYSEFLLAVNHSRVIIRSPGGVYQFVRCRVYNALESLGYIKDPRYQISRQPVVITKNNETFDIISILDQGYEERESKNSPEFAAKMISNKFRGDSVAWENRKNLFE